MGNTIHLTNSCLKILDTFQLRGLRQILGIQPAFYFRISHDKVIERANIIMNKGENFEITWEQFKVEKTGATEKIKRISTMIKNKQNTLLGHLIRADNWDQSLREVSIGLDNEQITRVWTHKKRVGKAREYWVTETRNRISREIIG